MNKRTWNQILEKELLTATIIVASFWAAYWSIRRQHPGGLPSRSDLAGLLLLEFLFYRGFYLRASFFNVYCTLCCASSRKWMVSILLSAVSFFCIRHFLPKPQEVAHRDENGACLDAYKPSFSIYPFRPLLFPCRTAHTRFFPKKHAFSYSYLLVGIPVGWRGSVGNILSADVRHLAPKGPIAPKAWFEVDSQDHLERGDSDSGLRGKLDTYLRSQVRLF